MSTKSKHPTDIPVSPREALSAAIQRRADLAADRDALAARAVSGVVPGMAEQHAALAAAIAACDTEIQFLESVVANVDAAEVLDDLRAQREHAEHVAREHCKARAAKHEHELAVVPILGALAAWKRDLDAVALRDYQATRAAANVLSDSPKDLIAFCDAVGRPVVSQQSAAVIEFALAQVFRDVCFANVDIGVTTDPGPLDKLLERDAARSTTVADRVLEQRLAELDERIARTEHRDAHNTARVEADAERRSAASARREKDLDDRIAGVVEAKIERALAAAGDTP